MPELPVVMVNDFLDTEIKGIFTTQYVEPDEMLLVHNLTGLKVKIVKKNSSVVTYLFSLTNGWIEIQSEKVSCDAVHLISMMLPKEKEKEEAIKREASIEEYRKYCGLKYMKNLAILLGESPEKMDRVFFEL